MVKPNREAAATGGSVFDPNLASLLAVRATLCAGATDKGTCAGSVYACNVLAFARVRAFVVGFELPFKCPTLASPCTSCGIVLFIARIPGAHKAYCWGFLVVNTIERNDLGR